MELKEDFILPILCSRLPSLKEIIPQFVLSNYSKFWDLFGKNIYWPSCNRVLCENSVNLVSNFPSIKLLSGRIWIRAKGRNSSFVVHQDWKEETRIERGVSNIRIPCSGVLASFFRRLAMVLQSAVQLSQRRSHFKFFKALNFIVQVVWIFKQYRQRYLLTNCITTYTNKSEENMPGNNLTISIVYFVLFPLP